MARDRRRRRSRIWIVGFGTVGRWLVSALHSQEQRLAARDGIGFDVTGIANAHDGFVHSPRGLDLEAVLQLTAAGGSITALPGVRRWRDVAEALSSADADPDVLVEVSASPRFDGQPGLAHMQEAIRRGVAVVTSNKWPVALHGVQLAAMARRSGVPFRAESTVMSGTPLIGPLVALAGGAVPERLRGILNATANHVLTGMAAGASYQQALDEAQRVGLAERDATDDVEGHDTVAKVMILSGLVFGRQLALAQVVRRGITSIRPSEIVEAAAAGARIKQVATLDFSEPDGRGIVKASVEPEALPAGDPLAGVDGTTNAVVFRGRPIGEVTITGPGAGTQFAGLGVLNDLISIATASR